MRPQDAALNVPTYFAPAKINTRWGSEPKIATDQWFADLDDDELPDVAIGRIPADSPAALSSFLDKVIRYEQSPPTGLWRRRINLVAGVGGFGVLADTVLETATRLVHQSRNSGELSNLANLCQLAEPLLPGPAGLSRAGYRADERGLFVLGIYRPRSTARIGLGACAVGGGPDPERGGRRSDCLSDRSSDCSVSVLLWRRL